MNWRAIVSGVAGVALVVAMILGRYEIVPVSSDGYAYRLDRWTGEIKFLTGIRSRKMLDDGQSPY